MKPVANQNNSVVQSRFKNLFEFLKAYNDLRTPVVSDISKQIATLWLSTLPKHPSVKLSKYIANPKQESEDGIRQDNDILLEVTRPIMTHCPKPPEILSEWLIPGYYYG